MRARRTAVAIRLAAVLALFPAAAAAAGAETGSRRGFDPFCHDLTRVIDAADDRRPFHILAWGRAAPPTLGFERGRCEIVESGGRTAWRCLETPAPEGLEVDRLAADTERCGTGAKRLPAPGAPGSAGSREALYALPGLTLRITETGDQGRAGRSVSYAVEVERRAGAF